MQKVVQEDKNRFCHTLTAALQQSGNFMPQSSRLRNDLSARLAIRSSRESHAIAIDGLTVRR